MLAFEKLQKHGEPQKLDRYMQVEERKEDIWRRSKTEILELQRHMGSESLARAKESQGLLDKSKRYEPIANTCSPTPSNPLFGDGAKLWARGIGPLLSGTGPLCR